MKNLLLILALGLSAFSSVSPAQDATEARAETSAQREFALRGTLSYGASTDWHPPASYVMSFADSSQTWWVDLQTNGLATRGDLAIRQNLVVIVRGYPTYPNDTPVFVATGIKSYTPRLDAPTMRESEYGRAVLASAYLGLSNGSGITTDLDSELAVQIYFPDEASHQAYINRRYSLGHSPDILVLNVDGRIVRITIIHGVGNFNAHPRVGVTN